jgi:NADH-quinone oxidoreductase subunit L
MGVSIGAYSAGMFHLMTHAFFKALLFMAAGSIIAAMANDQNIDRMSGFGKAMRFTSITFVCGALALAAFPGTSGFFSKDEILAFAEARGGMYLIFTVLGYVGALMTAVYSFRLVFRVLPGRPCAPAQELIETGHVAHEAPRNPATGEPEDTDVGFPGPAHHIAEQSAPMRAAMAVLAFLALVGGLVQVPGIDDVITKFLDPVFEGSALAQIHPSLGEDYTGLGIGGVIALVGIGIAYLLYVKRPERPRQLEQRLRPLHTLFVNKWYFDEAIDFLVVRPALAIGRFANRVFERFVVDGLVSGTEGGVRGASGVVRAVQNGFVRSYALLLIAGFAGLALYFLLSSS